MNEQLSPEDVRQWPQPGELWSLWDMHQIHGTALFRSLWLCGRLESLLIGNSLKDADDAMDESNKTKSRKFAEELFECVGKLGARITLCAVRDLIKSLDQPDLSFRQWGESVEEINNTLRRELEDTSVYVPERKHAALLELDEPPFGDIDLSKLGGAAGEISEAAKCLALRRNKACIFHLMLAMEEVARVLAASKGATVQDASGKWLTWLVIASNIDEQIVKPMAPGSLKEEWHRASALLKSVGNAWRNPTDHPGAS